VGLSSAVPSGLDLFSRVPGSELPGYYRQSLRDYGPIFAPEMSKLHCGRDRPRSGGSVKMRPIGHPF